MPWPGPGSRATTPMSKEMIEWPPTQSRAWSPTIARTPGEAASNEPDTGADVQQEGDFQGNY